MNDADYTHIQVGIYRGNKELIREKRHTDLCVLGKFRQITALDDHTEVWIWWDSETIPKNEISAGKS